MGDGDSQAGDPSTTAGDMTRLKSRIVDLIEAVGPMPVNEY
ncbi:MAG: class I SAM-dependent methyltransferase, partial [Mesorhizobium sp.]